MTTYMGHTIRRTDATTGTPGSRRIRPLYEIKGRFSKPAGQRPFLTTIEECREHIRDADAAARDRDAEYRRLAEEGVARTTDECPPSAPPGARRTQQRG